MREDQGTLTTQAEGGEFNPQTAPVQQPASLGNAGNNKNLPSKILGFFSGGSLIKKVLTIVVIFFILKMTIFR